MDTLKVDLVFTFNIPFQHGGKTFQIEAEAFEKGTSWRRALIFLNGAIGPLSFLKVYSSAHLAMLIEKAGLSSSLMSPVFDLTIEGKKAAEEWRRVILDQLMGAEGTAQQVVRNLPPTQTVPLLYEYIRAEEGRKYLVFKKSSNFQNLIVEIKCEPVVEFIAGELVLRFKANVEIFCHSKFQQEEVEEIRIARELALSAKKDSPLFETAKEAMEWGSELAKEMKAAADRAKYLPDLDV
ncbi:MAG: hypothetical protein Q8N55_03910 [bacterium]|nr:hypothetical protein [bacterium]